MYGYIYMIINKINNKKYVGKHKSDTLENDYMGSGIVLKRAKEKYGIENFEKTIIEIVYSNEELSNREIYWIEFYNCVKDKNFYNIASGGQGGFTTAGYTEKEYEEYTLKLSVSLQGENNPMYGKKHSEETLRKIRENSKGFDTIKYELTKPNEKPILFDSRKELVDYMFNTYGCSEAMIKKLINKGEYTTIRKRFMKMNGIVIKSISKQGHKE